MSDKPLHGNTRCVVCGNRKLPDDPVKLTQEGDPVHVFCLDDYIDGKTPHKDAEEREACRLAARAPVRDFRPWN